MSRNPILLYSDQEISENEQVDLKLVHLLSNTGRNIAYIASNPDKSKLYFKKKKQYYSNIGLSLAEYFDQEILESNEAKKRLISFDAIHLSGGNTYEFRNWVFTLGIDLLLTQYSGSGGVLIGTSAGAILMTPDISTALLCGDAAPTQESSTNGLSLVNFYIWPHYKNADEENRPRLPQLDESKQLYKIPDGSGIVVNNSRAELIGNVVE